MTSYSAIVYVHVIATLLLVAAMSVEAIVLRQLRQPPQLFDAESWLKPLRGTRLTATICLLVLFFSGGYLADRAQMWKMAWPKYSVAIVVAYGALAGLSGNRVSRVRKVLAAGTEAGSELLHKASRTVLPLSLGLRTGLLLAIVFLMVAKPAGVESLAATVVGLLLGFVIGTLGRGDTKANVVKGRLEASAR